MVMEGAALSLQEGSGTHDVVVGREDEIRLLGAFRALAAGEAGGLAEIYELASADLYALALWRTGSREDAADVVQEVFVALAATGARLDRVRRPRSYLLRMTHRAASRLARRRRPVESLDEVLLPAPGASPELRAQTRQAARALGTLPARQREAVGLHLVLGLSFREIGEATGVSRFTAASRYRLGMARLRRLMGENDERA